MSERTGAAPASGIDVMMLETAASLENVATGFYTDVGRLPLVRQGGAHFAAFLADAAGHHGAHAAAFNRAAVRAGGSEQRGGDPRYAAVVSSAWPTLGGLIGVVSVALTLEDAAAQTFIDFAKLASSKAVRTLFGSVAPVEAQHRAALLAMQTLLDRGPADLVAALTRPAVLPTAAPGAALPVSVYPTGNASAINEGAVS
jgi:hypothetical protein